TSSTSTSIPWPRRPRTGSSERHPHQEKHMVAYVVRRLWQMIPTLAGVMLLIFILFNWVGGDPAQVLAGKISNPEQIANIRKQLGVDEPFWVQLWVFTKQVFT